jgi:hypothetical protein
VNVRVNPLRTIPMFFEGAPDAVSKKDFDDLTKLVKGLTTVVQTQTQVINQMRQAPPITQQQQQQNNKDDDDDDDVDVNSMDNKSFATFLMKQVGGVLDKKMGDLSTRLDSGLKEVRTGRAKDEIEKFRGDHKDFDEWGLEISALAKQHPSLSINQLYTLAKTSDPEKAKTIDAKYVEKKEEPNPEDQRLTLFGGYRPSTSKTVGDDGKEPKKMTTTEALEKSWDDAVSKFPALKSLGDDSVD